MAGLIHQPFPRSRGNLFLHSTTTHNKSCYPQNYWCHCKKKSLILRSMNTVGLRPRAVLLLLVFSRQALPYLHFMYFSSVWLRPADTDICILKRLYKCEEPSQPISLSTDARTHGRRVHGLLVLLQFHDCALLHASGQPVRRVRGLLHFRCGHPVWFRLHFAVGARD